MLRILLCMLSLTDPPKNFKTSYREMIFYLIPTNKIIQFNLKSKIVLSNGDREHQRKWIEWNK